ncbi:NUDIX domain-containing protein [Streptomyces sp. NPDC050988]|uniref:NUDIX hydrolase n=1 Tax=Streptomyces sp. NPDC050988 TaxID=3365637 RepID=UPI0037BC620A
MPAVVKRSARAILLDGDELVLIKRTRPDRAPYWVTVGGGVEADDESIEAALHREVFEELGGTVEDAELVYLITDEQDGGGIGVQHIFAARLVSMDLAARTGSEFGKPERGGYEVVRVPFTAAAVRELDLMPPQLGEFIAANTGAIVSVLDTPVRKA